jgi:hypothetical protein
MNKLKATALIDQHRRRWRSQGSDDAIARRAERTYLGLALMNACMAAAFAALFHASGPLPRIALPVSCLIAGAIYYWQSRRFTQIRRLLSGSDAQMVSH